MNSSVALVCLLFWVGAAHAADNADLRAGVFTPARQAPEFSLAGSDGAKLTLNRYRGKVIALAFGYTSCGDVCPTTLTILANARKKLGARAADMQVVYITTDSERDDVNRMRQYLATFDKEFVGGSGTADELAKVRQSYGVAASKQVFPGGYVISHSSSVYLIDRAGRLLGLMPYGRTVDDFVHDVGIMLQQ